jgi:hypothetical protein
MLAATAATVSRPAMRLIRELIVSRLALLFCIDNIQIGSHGIVFMPWVRKCPRAKGLRHERGAVATDLSLICPAISGVVLPEAKTQAGGGDTAATKLPLTRPLARPPSPQGRGL